MSAAAARRGGIMVYPGSAYEQFFKLHPDNVKQANTEYAAYLKALKLVDPTPINDMVGWISRRMTGISMQHVIVFIAGRQGAGKSLLSGYLGERIDLRLNTMLRTNPGDHFSIANVRSVDKSGTLEMLDPKTLKAKQNQVFVLDDASISVNARSFQSIENQYINSILTTARIYRHCIIINTIASNLIDAVARSYADLGILAEGVIPGTNINRCKVYHLERSNPLGLGKRSSEAIGKYHQITIDGEQVRIIPWLAGRPSAEYEKAYNIVRKTNTDKLGGNIEEWIQNGATKSGKTIDARHAKLLEQYDVVLQLRKTVDENGKPLSMRAIAREVGMSSSGVDFVLGEAKRRGDLK